MCIAFVKKSTNSNYSWYAAIVRDENYEKSWAPIGKHWPDYPLANGYLDSKSGGSWLAYNDTVVALLLNREGSTNLLNSRGEITIKAVGNSTNAKMSLKTLQSNISSAYRPFNLLLMDKDDIFYLTNYGTDCLLKELFIQKITDELIMVNRSFPNDWSEPRIRFNFDSISKIADPEVDTHDWESWLSLFEEYQEVFDIKEEKRLNLRSKEWGSLNVDFFACPLDSQLSIVHHSIQLYDGLAKNS